MRRIAFAVVASAILCSVTPAEAGFTGIEVVHHTTVTIGTTERSVYRVYARFTDPGDSLVGWGGFQNFNSRLYVGPCAGGNFYQGLPYGSNHAPSQKSIDTFPDVQWDTFATIGVSIEDQGVPSDQTQFTNQFPPFIDGNDLTLINHMAYVANFPDQARADFAGDGDAPLRVLMMQLTVRSDQYPFGYVGYLIWADAARTQHIVNTQQSWIGLAAFGRCCRADGTCTITYQSTCAFINGYYIGCGACTSCAGTCVPDVAPHPGDGQVNIDDLVAVITSWGPCDPWNVCPADCAPGISGNNVVDIDDLVTVITSWGACR